MGSAGTRSPVEIEFALNLSGPEDRPKEFGFLQLRPVVPSRVWEEVELEGLPRENLLARSSSVMGNGRIRDVRDLVVVDREHFDRSRTVAYAEAVRRFNGELSRSGRPYVLVGVGRWGSTHPWLGIPVEWADISGARVIVEAGFKDFRVTPSQGTHFFQHLASFNVGYFTVNDRDEDEFVDWDWLARQPAVQEQGCVRHLRFEAPMVVTMDGRSREGVIQRPDV